VSTFAEEKVSRIKTQITIQIFSFSFSSSTYSSSSSSSSSSSTLQCFLSAETQKQTNKKLQQLEVVATFVHQQGQEKKVQQRLLLLLLLSPSSHGDRQQEAHRRSKFCFVTENKQINKQTNKQVCHNSSFSFFSSRLAILYY
jgi:hypothetical protein